MTGPKFLLLDTLIRLAGREEMAIEGVDAADIVRACLLFLASPSVETCPLAERIGYDEYEDNRTGTPAAVRGISVPRADALLIEVIESLMEEKQVPPVLASDFPELSREDYVAALWAIRCILHALQWTSYDAQHPPRYSEEESRRFIARTLEQLQHFRRTGEP
jgi:hypothetical protein